MAETVESLKDRNLAIRMRCEEEYLSPWMVIDRLSDLVPEKHYYYY